jgi:hypothetical protein
MTLQHIARALGGEVSGDQVLCPGPGHTAKDRSLAVKLNDKGDDVLVHSFAGDDPIKCKDHVRAQCGMPQWEPNGKAGHLNGTASKPKIVARYRYVDENDELLFEVVRYEPKDFRQRRPDGRGGWEWSVKGVRQVPYRLPEILEALSNERTIVIVEGEKDADALWKMNIPATCNVGGAGKWPSELSEFFSGADVVIIPDNDEPGREHVRKVAANLQGIASKIAVLAVPDLPAKGDVSDWIAKGGTADEFWHLVEMAAPPETFDSGVKGDDNEVWDVGDDPGPIPPRGWLLATQFCREFLSLLVAPGGTGKTALRYLQAIDLAREIPAGTKMPTQTITGFWKFQRCKVLIVGLEDGRNEMNRRLAGALMHHRIDRAEVKGHLFCWSPKGMKLAEMKGGSRQIGELERQLRGQIERRGIDLILVDPLVKAHAMDENDNAGMDFVCELLTKLSIEYDIAIDTAQHTRKGTLAAGDSDNGRGASAVRDAGRLAYTLATMTEDEAKTFGVPEGERRFYVRLDSAKVNIMPPAEKATWFKLVGVKLGNGTTLYPNGDEVQTVEPWTPPETWAGLSTVALNAALTEIDAGLANGHRYSDANAARDRAAWTVVQHHCPDKTEPQCREIIRTWVKNGVLYKDDYEDPIKREPCKGLRLDASKRPD